MATATDTTRVDAGTTLTFVPLLAGDIWRALLFVAILYLAVKLTLHAMRHGQVGAWFWARAALIMALLDIAVIQAERWGQPITLEGVPWATVVAVFAWLSVRNYAKLVP